MWKIKQILKWRHQSVSATSVQEYFRPQRVTFQSLNVINQRQSSRSSHFSIKIINLYEFDCAKCLMVSMEGWQRRRHCGMLAGIRCRRDERTRDTKEAEHNFFMNEFFISFFSLLRSWICWPRWEVVLAQYHEFMIFFSFILSSQQHHRQAQQIVCYGWEQDSMTYILRNCEGISEFHIFFIIASFSRFS